LNSFLKRFGVKLSRIQPATLDTKTWVNEEMYAGLSGLKNIGIPVKTIVDIGAASGSWTVMAKDIWPECSYVLFEPLEERKAELEKLSSDNSNIFIVPYAAGKTISEAKFYVADDLDGSGVTNGQNNSIDNVRIVKQTSIDIEIQKLQLSGEYIIKLDTHGYEVPIIEGCAEIIKNVSTFIIECYGFQIAENSLLFWEMCRYMNDLGFRLYNIVDVMNRQKDGSFWQCDAFFIRKDHEVFNTSAYQ
jgi:FkbM family methyltransferase